MKRLGREQHFLWKHVPNAISTGRLLTSPALLVLALTGRESAFKWLLLTCLASDVADGLIARALRLQSQRGAFLDSSADILVTLATIVGLVLLQGPFVLEHYPALLMVVGLYVMEVAAALWRYGRVSSFHTYLARAAAYAQAVFVMFLFFFGFRAWLFRATVTLSLVAYLEELLLLYLLPQWTSDVRGLYWVLTTRRAASRP